LLKGIESAWLPTLLVLVGGLMEGSFPPVALVVVFVLLSLGGRA
jgi:hypothetical protein